MIVTKPMTICDTESLYIHEPGDLIAFLWDFYKDLVDTENFSVVALNSASKVISVRVVAQGTVTNVLVHPREIFRNAITDNSSSIILVHNHPSGLSIPSKKDWELTKRIKDAGDIVGIKLIDHIILGSEYYSFLEHHNIVCD